MKLYNFINNGGWLPLFVFGGCWIFICLVLMVLNLIAHFSWVGMICDIFLILFCGWTIWKTIKFGLANKECFKINDRHLWKNN